MFFDNLVTTTIAYWVTGYAFAFGSYPNVILGTRYWVSERFGAKEDRRPGVENFTGSNPVYNLNNQDPYIHYFYHSMLAFLVTNIAASAFAERCRVPVYILFSILMSGKIRFEFNCLSLFIYLFIYLNRICLSVSFALDVGRSRLARSYRRCTSKCLTMLVDSVKNFRFDFRRTMVAVRLFI